MRKEIKYTDQLIPNAYHGTSNENAKKICRDGFIASCGEKQFLGDGIYFYENSLKHAQNWAERYFKGEPIAIIKAQVVLGRCLDLNNWEHRNLIVDVKERLISRGHKESTDAAVINFIAKNFNPKIDTVRACYVQPKYGNLFPGSKFYSYSQLILCVKNKNNISGCYIAYQSLDN